MTENKYQDALESERLITRWLKLSDAHHWEKFYSDPANYKFLPQLGGETPHENAVLAIERQLNRYRDKTFGLQALVEKETGALVGQCGLLYQKIEGNFELEIGYQLFSNCTGKGYAAEAAILFRDYGFNTVTVNRIVSLIDIDNLSSQKVAEKMGMTRLKEIKYHGSDIYLYEITREKWKNLDS